MVCVGLSERDLKNFWGGSGLPWHPPSSAPGCHVNIIRSGNTGINDPELLVQSRGRHNRTAPLFRPKR